MHRSEYKRRSQKITPSQEDFFFLNRHRELPGVVKKPSRVSAVWRSLPPPSGPQPARPAPWRPRALGKVSATARLPPRSSSADPWGLRELAGGGVWRWEGMGTGGSSRDKRRAALALSLPLSVSSLSSAPGATQARVRRGVFSLALRPFPATFYLFE